MFASSGAQLRRRRRRLLGNKIRKRVGQPRRKLLQSDSAGQFGGTVNIAFNIAISPQAATQATYDGGVIISGKLLRPGDVGYPFDTDADGKLSPAEKEKIIKALEEGEEQDLKCHEKKYTIFSVLTAVYYGLILLISFVSSYQDKAVLDVF